MTQKTKPLWWLSFASDVGFLGVAIVRADDFLDAVRWAHTLDCNPGGQCAGAEFPSDIAERVAVADIGRLLTKKEAKELGAMLGGVE